MKRKTKSKKQKKFTARKDILFRPSDLELISKAADISSVTVCEFIRHCALLQSKFVLEGQHQNQEEERKSYQQPRTRLGAVPENGIIG
jgi:uncharacterized protein (DUF1778 family)